MHFDGVTIPDGQWSYGALYDQGTLKSPDTVMHNHRICLAEDPSGYLYVQDSTINQNFAHNGYGGGIFNATNGVIEITYSTIRPQTGELCRRDI